MNSRGGRGRGRGNFRSKYDTGGQPNRFHRQKYHNLSTRGTYNNNNNNSGRGREVHFDNANDDFKGRLFRGNSFRSQRYGISKGQPSSRNGQHSNDPDSQWFKVTIPHGIKSSKDFILRSVQNGTDTPFTPYNYHQEGHSVVFYVMGEDTSDALKSMSRRIEAPNGFKLTIICSRSPIPQTPMDGEITQQIKEAMSRRYNADTKSLDLSQFRNDSGLQGLGLYIPLSRSSNLNAVARVIRENIPDIALLDLSDNKVSSLETLSTLSSSCKYLRSLNMGKNQIRNITELDHLRGIELEELILEANPLCDSFKDQTTYISSVRSRFPKVVKLDGDLLPAPIGFDVGDEGNLPAALGNSIPEENNQFVISFLEQFYALYDSEDRQPLIAAYHDQALFSFSISRSDVRSQTYPQTMINESRNLIRVKDLSIRSKILKQGRVNIVASLCELPKTKHEADSFLIDVPFFNNSLIIVVLNGVYKELTKKQSFTRAFCRSFTIVPHGQGFVIINDLLLLTNASPEQLTKYGKSASLVPTGPSFTPPVAAITAIEMQANSGDSSSNSNNLVLSFSQRTGMNSHFSAQCLEENNYNFDAAVKVFEKLNSQGAIPAEAFRP